MSLRLKLLGGGAHDGAAPIFDAAAEVEDGAEFHAERRPALSHLDLRAGMTVQIGNDDGRELVLIREQPPGIVGEARLDVNRQLPGKRIDIVRRIPVSYT